MEIDVRQDPGGDMRKQTAPPVNGLLWRAVLAFLALPGMVAFVIPLVASRSANRPFDRFALGPLSLGIFLLLWCVRISTWRGKAPWRRGRRRVSWSRPACTGVRAIRCTSRSCWCCSVGRGVSLTRLAALRAGRDGGLSSAGRARRGTVAGPDPPRRVDSVQGSRAALAWTQLTVGSSLCFFLIPGW